MKKIFWVALAIFVYSLINPAATMAEEIPPCDITVSGTSLYANTAYTVYPVRKTAAGDFVYPIKACVGGEKAGYARSCVNHGDVMKAAVRKTFWSSTDLKMTSSGDNRVCFEGDLIYGDDIYDGKLRLDIESSGPTCGNKQQVCQRVVFRKSKVLLEDAEECQQALESFSCDKILAEPTELIVNESINFLLHLHEYIGGHSDICDFDYTGENSLMTMQIFPPSGSGHTKDLTPGDNSFNYTPTMIGDYKILLYAEEVVGSSIGSPTLSCERSFYVGDEDNPGEWKNLLEDENKRFQLCRQVPDDGRRQKCEDCFTKEGIWTSLGCISRNDTSSIVDKILTIGISLAGGVALLIILAAAFILSTSQGEPKRTSEAKEMLTHAVIGLLFIIFSITILEFIGVKILRIPGFGE